jgi:hypothetical protein
VLLLLERAAAGRWRLLLVCMLDAAELGRDVEGLAGGPRAVIGLARSLYHQDTRVRVNASFNKGSQGCTYHEPEVEVLVPDRHHLDLRGIAHDDGAGPQEAGATQALFCRYV